MSTVSGIEEYDLKNTISDNRLVGLWRMMTGYRLAYLGATVTQALAAVFKTVTFLLLRYLVDQVLGVEGQAYLIPWIALSFVLLAAMEGGFTYLSGRLAAFTGEGIARRLRNYLFDHLQRLTFAYHAKTPTGDLISRVTSDVDAMRRFFSEQAIGVGRIVLLFTINFYALLRLNTRLAWISIVIVPLIIVTSIFFFRKVTKAYEAFQAQDSILSTTLQENLTGVRVVKAFARQEYERGKFDRDNLEKYRRGRKLNTMHSLFWPVSDTICGFQMLAGFTVAAVMAINGEITVGTYMAYAGLVVWLIWPMRNLGRLIVQTSTGLVSYGRVLEIIRQQREPLTEGAYQPQRDCQGAITFDDVCFEYESDSQVLKHISLDVKPGQVVALLGSTGSGKTSLVNLLPRFYDYTCGSLKLDGIELRDYPREYLRRQIGIVEQEPFLFSRSIRENISYGVGREVTDEEVFAAARAASIHDVIQSFPEGYNTLVGEKGVTLSGGQKQRVTIARTILKNPRILILDDSTSSVDTETEEEIRNALDGLMKNRTTFIIAHRIQSVMNADQIVVMDHGEIVQAGKHEQLLADQEGIYRKIYDIQMLIETEIEQEVSAGGGHTSSPETESSLEYAD